ncbi:hypothetical protein [Streptomyces sp. NPDC059466]|uniref:hypothetical protein n=1 Tax=unclassified Streptomyces TaxID=2593676 RepID=UPI0036793035
MKKISIALGAAVGIILIASPAYAVSYPSSWPGVLYTDDYAGLGGFQSDGDYVGVNDLDADGKSTVTRWETDYGRSGECKDTNGADNGWTSCNYDMDENHSMRYNVCLRNYSNDIGWENCSGWSPWISIASGGVS